MKNSTKGILIGAAAAGVCIGGAIAASYCVVRSLVNVAMNRRAPKLPAGSNNKISGTPHMAELLDRMDAAEEALRASGCETVEIVSHDGLRLVGHYCPCEGAERLILAMHGWRSSWAKDFGLVADFWREQKCAVLYAEQRAQGESEGEHISFGLLERYDCLAWARKADELAGKALPIYLDGISMGATTVMMASALDLPENVKGIIADCGFSSTEAIWSHVIRENIGLPYNRMTALFADYLSRKKIHMGTSEYSTADALRDCQVPVLFIHGSDDNFVPIEMTYENYRACASKKRLFVVPGAGHGMSYVVDPEGCKQAIIEFWRENDKSQ